MSSNASNVAGLVMHWVNCMLSLAYAIGVQFLSSGAARFSMCCSPIAVSNFCWGVVMSATWSVMLCVVGGSADSEVGVRLISIDAELIQMLS